MSKPVLGRGLADLMEKTAAPKQFTAPEASQTESGAGPGVSSLLKGKRDNLFSEPEAPVQQPTPTVARSPEDRSLPFPLWYLFAADVLLVLLAFLLIFKDPAALEWKRVTLACVATLLGGILAAAGALLAEK